MTQWNICADCRGMTQSEIIDAIFDNRGIEDMGHFLHPTEADMLPFEDLINIKEAAEIIINGIKLNKRFCIYADVDTDGITAGAIATEWLSHYTQNVDTMINEGKVHGIVEIPETDILWVVDSIQASPRIYQELSEQGIVIVCTDHHVIPNELITCMDEFNFYLVSSANEYQNPELSGSATTWKLCKYISKLLGDNNADSLVDLAACGIIADMCSVGADAMENRYICSQGFSNQQSLAIKKINGGYAFDGQAVSFGIAPMINAANRMNKNVEALSMFLSSDTKEVNNYLKILKQCKEDQNAVVTTLMPSILAQASEQTDRKCMIFMIPEEYKELTGLIGNRLLEQFMRPVIVLRENIKIDEDTGEVLECNYSGSARGIGVDNFQQYITNAGGFAAGHENACGIEISGVYFEDFKKRIEEELADIEFIVETTVDIEIDEDQLTVGLIKSIEEINKISGAGFPAVNICIRGIEDYVVGTMSNGKHLKITTPTGLSLIMWNYNGDYDKLVPGTFINAIGRPAVNFFNKTVNRQLIMSDFTVEEDI